MNTTPNVLVGVPTMGAMHPNLVANLLIWAREFPAQNLSFYFTFKIAPVDRARNEIVRFFFQEHRDRQGTPARPFTHLLFLDSDTVPPADGLKRLLSHDKDIVSGLTPILHFDKKSGGWNTFDNCFTHQDREDGLITKTHMAQRHTGVQEIFRCGSSCILIKREVFEGLDKPYYRFTYNEDGSQTTVSEDINFCDRARDAGFKLYADTDVVCSHYKEMML